MPENQMSVLKIQNPRSKAGGLRWRKIVFFLIERLEEEWQNMTYLLELVFFLIQVI